VPQGEKPAFQASPGEFDSRRPLYLPAATSAHGFCLIGAGVGCTGGGSGNEVSAGAGAAGGDAGTAGPSMSIAWAIARSAAWDPASLGPFVAIHLCMVEDGIGGTSCIAKGLAVPFGFGRDVVTVAGNGNGTTPASTMFVIGDRARPSR
jgi:hypothetical protein